MMLSMMLAAGLLMAPPPANAPPPMTPSAQQDATKIAAGLLPPRWRGPGLMMLDTVAPLLAVAPLALGVGLGGIVAGDAMAATQPRMGSTTLTPLGLATGLTGAFLVSALGIIAADLALSPSHLAHVAPSRVVGLMVLASLPVAAGALMAAMPALWLLQPGLVQGVTDLAGFVLPVGAVLVVPTAFLAVLAMRAHADREAGSPMWE